MNGVRNRLGEALDKTKKLFSDTFQSSLFYNATHGIFDFLECSLNYMGITTAKGLAEEWREFLTNNPVAYILHFCHSQGAIITRNALKLLDEGLRQRILVAAFAPAAYISDKLCHSVTHYEVSFWRDPIPYIDISGRIQCKDTIVVLDSHPSAKFHDHNFDSPTYRDSIEFERKKFTDFVNNL